MGIIQDDAKKLVQVWLTRQEGENSAVQERLQPMYAQWKQQKYMVAVFHSGQEDLKEHQCNSSTKKRIEKDRNFRGIIC